ncbi:MAG: hypothetical protein JNG90_10945 [Planctomycetaceae bacterium]|nr:hypothetical protein [Planctomycetaceae bacterium]
MSQFPTDFVPAQPAVEPAPSPLNHSEVSRIEHLLQRVRGMIPQIPGDRVAEITSLLATVEGHLQADPPNAVAAREALELIRDELEGSTAAQVAAFRRELDCVLEMLGAV